MPTWHWGQPLDGIIQVAYIVEDLQTAMSNFGSRLNLGPRFLFEHFEFQWIKYPGASSDLDVTIALANSGHMMFEVIQQNDAQPSVYREILDRQGSGFHHWAVAAQAENYQARLRIFSGRVLFWVLRRWYRSAPVPPASTRRLSSEA